MTEKNANMRDVVKNVEGCAMVCLASQPSEDDACERHLVRALAKIAETTKEYLGLVEVEAYNIRWETDGEKVDLPESYRLFMQSDEVEDGVADALSDRFGWLVKSLEWRML
jgi:hypothetical protein